MLASLADLGYEVEWRVVNAADYGFPQKRRRVFIVGRLGRPTGARRTSCLDGRPRARLPRRREGQRSTGRRSRSTATSRSSATRSARSRANALRQRRRHADQSTDGRRAVWTPDVESDLRTGRDSTLGDILEADGDVPDAVLRRGRRAREVAVPQGRQEPDADQSSDRASSTPTTRVPSPSPTRSTRPSRTILTGEGGATPSRFKHLIQIDGRSIPTADAARARAAQRLPGRLDRRACPTASVPS